MVTDKKPIEIFFNQAQFPEIYKKIEKHQIQMLDFHNKHRVHNIFHPGEEIYVKSDPRRKDKRSYVQYLVKEDRKFSVLTTNNKVIHEDNIKNKPK